MKSKSEPIKYRLSKIDTRQFSIQEEFYKPDQPVQYSTGIGFGINSTERIFGIMISIRFHNVESPAFALIEGGILVQIDESSWNKNLKDGKQQLSMDFLRHAAAISVGAIRGVFHEKTKGTVFNQFMIPTIDLTKLISENLVFDVDTYSAPLNG